MPWLKKGLTNDQISIIDVKGSRIWTRVKEGAALGELEEVPTKERFPLRVVRAARGSPQPKALSKTPTDDENGDDRRGEGVTAAQVREAENTRRERRIEAAMEWQRRSVEYSQSYPQWVRRQQERASRKRRCGPPALPTVSALRAS